MGALEGIEESIKNFQTTKNALPSSKKIYKTYKIRTPTRFKIRKGRELGGNHDMTCDDPPADL